MVEETSPNVRRNNRVSVYIGSAYAPDVKIRWFSPPRQLQKWGADQISPHTDWGNIFFDLFYVAGFFGMGSIIVYQPDWEGILYYASTFFSLYSLWHAKVWYDSKFSYGDDIYHKIFEVTYLLALATAISYVAPVEKMSRPSEYQNTFGFSIALSAAQLMNILRYAECYCFGRGQQKNIKYECLRYMSMISCQMPFYIAAAIISGIAYYGSDEKRYLRALAEDTAGEEAAVCDDSAKQALPMLLCLCGYFCYELLRFVSICFCLDEEADKAKTIPANVYFLIHREGEWIHLVLGETLLSLLLVDSPHDQFEGVFYFGILTITFYQLLHFRYQPHDPEHHAQSKDKNAGFLFSFLFPIYSWALVGVGAIYKLFLYNLNEKYALGDGRRLSNHPFGRWLASGGGESYGCDMTLELKTVGSVWMFSYFFSIVYYCDDIFVIAHNGLSRENLKKGFNRLFFKEVDGQKKINFAGIVGVFLPREIITMFSITLWLWQDDFQVTAGVGCACVLVNLASSMVASIVYPSEDDGHHHDHHHYVSDDEDSDDGEKEKEQQIDA